MRTYSLEQINDWIDRNFFIGSPEAARTAMEDAASLVPEQESIGTARRLLEKHHCVVTQKSSALGLALQEMAARGLVDIEDSPHDGDIAATLK